MKKNSTILAGIIGVLIILYGIIISSNNYLGCSQQQYSVLNHFVSELGQYSCSTKANRFNFSLIIGTPFLIFFYLNIIPKSSRKINLLFRLIILAMGSSAVLVGCFSMDSIIPHLVSANIFFLLCFFACLLFIIYFQLINRQEVSKYFMFSAIILSISLLINIIQFINLDQNMLNILKDRPPVLFICIIEWVSLAAMLLFFIFSINHYKNKD